MIIAVREEKPLYPQSYAFVLQIAYGAVDGGEQAGRIEHMASGRACRFDSGKELLDFVRDVLATLADPAEVSGPT